MKSEKIIFGGCYDQDSATKSKNKKQKTSVVFVYGIRMHMLGILCVASIRERERYWDV